MTKDEEKLFDVDIFNDAGEPIGAKPWPQVDRRRDVLRNAFVYVFTPEREMLLATITEEHLSKKIYKGKLGSPAVTLVRHGESCEKAATRALVNDLAIYSSKLVHLGDTFETFNDGTKRHMCVFFCVHDANVKPNGHMLANVRRVRRQDMETLLRLNPEQFSPQFVQSYQRYKRHFPF
ncbi:MAG: hypothetical protein COV10_00010 [Candidatus Vogelbacteria bacterium CG10_big_fil_rev_8_21_14_0_10_51_16]|uniref:Nudix hydrolase domain-containing protein n=1 Tax=Candidatus Vogelbacteria bacterium CG10_big_fil_rev_8_21_14_0_10_51_16 TaxID=1975045 RepID=A0A2H0RFQ7_9BACT|nr:MAG: hypothetical protein COV10_00010 [Candidatus Vogelbacteria bacterium CG10_big_fil_rev_8_21_14_0_10_51_16]